jgi:hypothetical protein
MNTISESKIMENKSNEDAIKKISFELSEFFKHCMNVGGCMRNEYNHEGPPLWNGWMRIQITPYLTDGKLDYYREKPDNEYWNKREDDAWIFKNCLLYTIQDYIDYGKCIGYSINRAEKLLMQVKEFNNEELVNIIENNSNNFPTINDYNHSNIIQEKWDKDVSCVVTDKLNEFEELISTIKGLINKVENKYEILKKRLPKKSDLQILGALKDLEGELLCSMDRFLGWDDTDSESDTTFDD